MLDNHVKKKCPETVVKVKSEIILKDLAKCSLQGSLLLHNYPLVIK